MPIAAKPISITVTAFFLSAILPKSIPAANSKVAPQLAQELQTPVHGLAEINEIEPNRPRAAP
jgi:hypothetical protein